MESRKDAPVRQRILQAAGEVFGCRGFKAATVREICRRADANVAAVNYYFGGKEALYREVVRDLIAGTFAKFSVETANPEASAQERLAVFVRATLSRLLSPGGLSGYRGRGQLVARELAEPSPILDTMVEDFIAPTAAVLGGIVSDLLGPAAGPELAMRCQVSVIGQCFHYAMARPVLTRLGLVDYSRPEMVAEVADHITRFSLEAMAGLRRRIESEKERGAGRKRNRRNQK